MSKYTTQVRFICETAAGLSESEGQTSVKQIIAAAIPSVFDFDFPIFDESYRNVLESKILKHYYTREIGLETVGLWKLKLDTKLNEIMPFYNQLYKSELIEFNPMYDVDLTRDHTLNRSEQTEQTGTETADATKNGTVDTTTSGTKTGTADTKESGNKDGTSRENIDVSENQETEQNSKSDTDIKNTTGSTSEESATGTKTHYDKYSDTPQGSLQNVQNDTYLTNARMVNDNDTQTGKTTVSGEDTSTGSTTADTSTTTDSTSETTRTGSTTEETSATQNVKTHEDTSGTQNTTSADTEKRNATQTANKELTSLDDYLEHVKGKNGGVSYSAMLNEFRTTFLNIDMQVINELSDLFMNLW